MDSPLCVRSAFRRTDRRPGPVVRFLAVLASGLMVTGVAVAQPERPHPLAGVNSLSIEGTYGLVSSDYSAGALLPADRAITLGRLGGESSSVGLIFSRSMPDFFISRGLPIRGGVEYLHLSQETSGTGRLEPDDRPGPVDVTQRTRVDADIVAATLGIRVNTSRGRTGLMPTVDLGATFGHVLGLDVRTATDPEGVVPSIDFDPDRRYYFNAINLGVGLGVALGRPEESMTIIPSISMRAATTSLTKNEGEEIVPFSVAAGLEIRLPLGSP